MALPWKVLVCWTRFFFFLLQLCYFDALGEIFSIYRLYSLTSLGNDLLQWSKLVIHPVRP